MIEIAFYDSVANRRRRKVGYIGEDGLSPHVPYKVANGLFVPVERPVAAESTRSVTA
jgi:hypothetical protein